MSPLDPQEQWSTVLHHRPPAQHNTVIARFTSLGITSDTVATVLRDAGDELIAGFAQRTWPRQYASYDGVALLACEVAVYATYVARRAACARSAAAAAIMTNDDNSLAQVATRLGISKQNVHRAIARPVSISDFEHVLALTHH